MLQTFFTYLPRALLRAQTHRLVEESGVDGAVEADREPPPGVVRVDGHHRPAPRGSLGIRPGWFTRQWNWLKGLYGDKAAGLFAGLFEGAAWKNLGFLGGLPLFGELFGAGANGLRWIFAGWGGINQAFNFVAGLVIAGMQIHEHPALEGA